MGKYTSWPIKIYGISQNPDTKEFIIILLYHLYQEDYCEKCDNEYTYTNYSHYTSGWCQPCQINSFRRNFTNWTSGNEKIDDFIQGMQLKIESENEIVFEWVPYNQFSDIKEIGKDNSTKVYSAVWKDGPLDYVKYEYLRIQNEKITLKYLCNSQNISDEILNEV